VSRIAARMGRRLAPARGSRFDWVAIRSYYEAGHTVAECCRQFGVSRGAWDRAVTRGDLVPRLKGTPPASETRNAVERLLANGMTQAAIAKELGVSKATVAHHFRALGFLRTSASPVDMTGLKFNVLMTVDSPRWSAAPSSGSLERLGRRP